MTFCKGEISGQIQARYKEIKSNIHGKLLPENHFKKMYWKQKVKVQPFEVTIRKQAECHCNCVRSAYICLHDSDFRKLFYGEKKKSAWGWQECVVFFFCHPKTIHYLRKIRTHWQNIHFFFPATNIYTAYLVTMLSSNMLKIRVHLLPAAELSYRKGGGWAGPKSRCQLQGCKWPGEEWLAGHSHGTEFFPKKKAARESCAWMTQEF